MSDENKEKLPEELENEAVNDPEGNLGDDWTWDATVPETAVDNITFEDLTVSVSEETASEVSEQPAEEPKADDVPEVEEKTEEEEQSEPADDGCCIVCGKKRKNSPSDLYCSECYEKFLRTDYGVGHIIFAFVMVVVAVVGYFICASTLPMVPKLIKAQNMLNDGHFDSAISLCEEIDEEIDTVNSGIDVIMKSFNKNAAEKAWLTSGRRTALINIEANANVVDFMSSYYTDMVESYFTDKDGSFDRSKLDSPKYDFIREIYDFAKEVYSLGSKYGEALSEFYSYSDDSEMTIDYDKAMKYLDGLEVKTRAEKCMREYYRSAVIAYTEKGEDKLVGYLNSLIDNAGEYDFLFVPYVLDAATRTGNNDMVIELAKKEMERNINGISAYYYIVEAYFAKNDLTSADNYCEEMKKNNPDQLYYYGMKAECLRRQGKFEESVGVCTEGIAKEEDAELYRQQAISYMLLENGSKAAEAAKQSYNIIIMSGQRDSNSITTLNTAALILFLCNGAEDDIYRGIADEFEEAGLSLDEKVQNCIKGEIEFADIFMKGDFDIA